MVCGVFPPIGHPVQVSPAAYLPKPLNPDHDVSLRSRGATVHKRPSPFETIIYVRWRGGQYDDEFYMDAVRAE